MRDPVNLMMFFMVGAMLIFSLTFLVLFARVVRHWIRAAASGAPISMLSILGMRLRGNPPVLLVDAYVLLRRAGVDCTISEVEGRYMDNRTRVRTSHDLAELVNSKVASEEVSKSA